MKKTGLVLATRNKHKVSEIKAILKGFPVKVFTTLDFPRLKEVKEDGKTLEANSAKKALSVAKQTGMMALADDTGLFVQALKEAPGVYSARFAGPDCDYAKNNQKLLKLLGDLPSYKRKAVFSCVITLAFPDGKVRSVRGDLKGRIAFEEKGKNGFGYDPVFVVPRYKKTFSQLSTSLKNRVSHRSLALMKMKKVLKRLCFSR